MLEVRGTVVRLQSLVIHHVRRGVSIQWLISYAIKQCGLSYAEHNCQKNLQIDACLSISTSA